MSKDKIESIRYLFSLILFVIFSLAALALTSEYIQPLSGDLTRMGGYAERDFGWTSSRKVLSNEAKVSNSYDKYYDIVVLGDSFSKSGFWQSFLNEKTGLSFTTLHWDDTSIENIIKSKVFINNPPKIFIAEMGVRTLPKHFSSSTATCVPSSPIKIEGLKFTNGSKQSIPLVEIRRDTTTDWSEINLKFALVYIENSILRFVFDNDFTKVKKYSLLKDNLFSNTKSNEILVLNSWFESKKWTINEINIATCYALEIQNEIQSNGKTVFILLPIPDKGTAYSKYIINPEFTNIAEINNMLLQKKINTTHVDALLQKAIDSMEKDVYLPNDTHFGTLGYQIAAQSVYELLVEIGVIAGDK